MDYPVASHVRMTPPGKTECPSEGAIAVGGGSREFSAALANLADPGAGSGADRGSLEKLETDGVPILVLGRKEVRSQNTEHAEDAFRPEIAVRNPGASGGRAALQAPTVPQTHSLEPMKAVPHALGFNLSPERWVVADAGEADQRNSAEDMPKRATLDPVRSSFNGQGSWAVQPVIRLNFHGNLDQNQRTGATTLSDPGAAIEGVRAPEHQRNKDSDAEPDTVNLVTVRTMNSPPAGGLSDIGASERQDARDETMTWPREMPTLIVDTPSEPPDHLPPPAFGLASESAPVAKARERALPAGKESPPAMETATNGPNSAPREDFTVATPGIPLPVDPRVENSPKSGLSSGVSQQILPFQAGTGPQPELSSPSPAAKAGSPLDSRLDRPEPTGASDADAAKSKSRLAPNIANRHAGSGAAGTPIARRMSDGTTEGDRVNHPENQYGVHPGPDSRVRTLSNPVQPGTAEASTPENVALARPSASFSISENNPPNRPRGEAGPVHANALTISPAPLGAAHQSTGIVPEIAAVDRSNGPAPDVSAPTAAAERISPVFVAAEPAKRGSGGPSHPRAETARTEIATGATTFRSQRTHADIPWERHATGPANSLHMGKFDLQTSDPVQTPQFPAAAVPMAMPKGSPVATLRPTVDVHQRASDTMSLGTVPENPDDRPGTELSFTAAEIRAGATNATQSHPSAPSPAAAAVVQQIVQQIVQAGAQLGTQPIELSLSPEELGRVRMTLTTTEQGLTLAILADRDDTLALLRRHMEHLASDLRNLGFANLSFQFGPDQRQNQGGDKSQPQRKAGRIQDAAHGLQSARTAAGPAMGAQLDILM